MFLTKKFTFATTKLKNSSLNNNFNSNVVFRRHGFSNSVKKKDDRSQSIATPKKKSIPDEENLNAIRSRVKFLSDKLNKFNTSYYNKGVSLVSDAEYDSLFRELQSIETKHPVFRLGNSPTATVGAKSIYLHKKEDPSMPSKTLKHFAPMLSLRNIYSFEELYEFVGQINRGISNQSTINHNDLDFVCEMKYDGMAANLQYSNGKLENAVSRGDGIEGDVMTENLTKGASKATLPKSISAKNLHFRKQDGSIVRVDKFEVRCEVVMRRTTFSEINAERSKHQATPFKNSRNLVAGLLKVQSPQDQQTTKSTESDTIVNRKTSAYLLEQRPFDVFDVIAHSLVLNPSSFVKVESKDLDSTIPNLPTTHAENLNFLESIGFKTCIEKKRCGNVKEVENFISKWSNTEQRDQFIYDSDGVVVKLNSLTKQEELGAQSRFPRWAVAFKFAAKAAETTLENITLQVGRSGILTPVAIFTPTPLMGSTVSRATLHNFNYIAEKNLRIGDKILIQKAGEVIPRVISKVNNNIEAESDGSQQTSDQVMRTLLSCNAEGKFLCPCEKKSVLELVGAKTKKSKANDLYCVRDDCESRNIGKLSHFCEEGLQIEFLAEGQMRRLFSAGFVKSYADILRLEKHKKELELLEGWGMKRVENLLKAIEKAKKTATLDRLICAFGIPGIGNQSAKVLAQHFGSLNKLMNTTLEELRAVPNIGEKTSKTLLESFQNQSFKEMVNELSTLLSPNATSNETKNESNSKFDSKLIEIFSRFKGKTIVITGTFRTLDRPTLIELLAIVGGRVTSGVSKKTQVLLLGSSAQQDSTNLSSKHQFALSNNIEIVKEDDLLSSK